MDVGPGELAVVVLVLVLLFGGAKIPQLARSLGQAKREFEAGARGAGADGGTAAPEPGA